MSADRLHEARGGIKLLPEQGNKSTNEHLVYELMSEVTRGSLNTVRSYLEGDPLTRGVHPDARCLPDGYSKPLSTALTSACIMGHLEIVELLLSHGATADLQDFDHDGKPTEGTALHYAAVNNRPAIVSCLLQHGASTACLDDKGITPLEWAQEADSDPFRSGVRGCFSTVIRLLTLSAASTTDDGATVLREALEQHWDGPLLMAPVPWAIDAHAALAADQAISGSLLTDDVTHLILCQCDSESACQIARVNLGSYRLVHAELRQAVSHLEGVVKGLLGQGDARPHCARLLGMLATPLHATMVKPHELEVLRVVVRRLSRVCEGGDERGEHTECGGDGVTVRVGSDSDSGGGRDGEGGVDEHAEILQQQSNTR